MQQGDLEPSSLMLASYWSSRFEDERKRIEMQGTKDRNFLITDNPYKTKGIDFNSRQEYENHFFAIRQSNLEQVFFQVDIYIC